MKEFALLFQRLDTTTKTNEKLVALADYYARANSGDAAWATWFLSGNRLRRLVPTKLLQQWASERAGIPEWLLRESYHAVGDLAETLSLVVPTGVTTEQQSLTHWVESRLQPLHRMEERQQRERLFEIWDQTTPEIRFVVMKLITGGFRVGVSKRLVTRAIAQHCGLTTDVIAHRLMGDWVPTGCAFERMINPDVQDTVLSQPYPFCLAHPVNPESGPEPLGDSREYFAEWKWDGIRGQVIRRRGETFLWSRGEELMENRWPEIESAAECLPEGTVLDGEILAATTDGKVLPFASLQRRIGRKRVGKKLLSEVPVVFHAFDLLEEDGQDIRNEMFLNRRERLESLLSQIDHPHIRVTDLIPGDRWQDWFEIRQRSRENHAEGLMLKRRDGRYDVGRVRGTWWKWKVEPHTIDAVLIYAQKGHGRRSSLFTDYTFAVWDGEVLVPFAKAYSGLNDSEIREVDRFVRKNTKESFGPVRSVTPKLVMELAFEGLQPSSRHKSGIATRFPRILRWRHDKQPEDANTLNDLKELLPHDLPTNKTN